ncbi:MAG: cellulose biosynthesis protein BcsS [Roseiarcus sp.]
MVASLAAHPVARAEDATDLLFFSGDLMTARSYGGVGWLHAASGLDFSGPVFSAELGRPEISLGYGQATAGWRFVQSGVWVTLLAGVELDPENVPVLSPLASADLWWEPVKGWMTTAQVQATPEYVSWRAAVGLKPADGWPWIGPEAGSNAGEPRVGLHATGLRLPGGFEARVSAGVAWWCGRSGPYGELSVWRRF